MKLAERIKRSFKKWAKADDLTEEEMDFQAWALVHCKETNHGEALDGVTLSNISIAYHAGYQVCHRSMSRK